MQRHPSMGFILCISLLSLLAAQARADVCGGESEDKWDGPCLEGIPHGHGVFTFASGVCAVLSSFRSNLWPFRDCIFPAYCLWNDDHAQREGLLSHCVSSAVPPCTDVPDWLTVSLTCPGYHHVVFLPPVLVALFPCNFQT